MSWTAERRSYHKLVGRRQRQEYVRGSKTHVKSYSFVNRNHGCYRPFGAIVQKEGGWKDKAAVRGTAVMALKCIKMGGEWTSRSLLTERLEFWRIKCERKRTSPRLGVCAGSRRNLRGGAGPWRVQ